MRVELDCMDAHTWDRPFVAVEDMALYRAIDADAARRYGATVRAAAISNVDYKVRFQKLSSTRRMNPPPRSGRIFPGYVVVRKLGTPGQYETWIPEHGFTDTYRASAESNAPTA